MNIPRDKIDLVANTVRGLAMDGVQKANSGHPGMPMGTADFTSVLFLKHLRHDPKHPDWRNRDRFVLSAGHGSMLLYSILHLSGYDVSLDDLKHFRQLGSKTPGHPEFGHTPGVETTTGPLGQGCGNAVGMAIAEEMLAARFNEKDYPVADHYTYVIAGDGDMMEGISHEALSLAGHLRLKKLILFYDCNCITIEGSTALAYSDNVCQRFQAYNWNVIEIDGHDHDAIDAALTSARAQDRPTLIIGNTCIGKGSPNLAGSHKVHGEPLGQENVTTAKKHLGLPVDKDFYVSDEVRKIFASRLEELSTEHRKWNELLTRYAKAYPDKHNQFDSFFTLDLPANLEESLPVFDPQKPVASRNASGTVIQALAKALPNFVGGSADLAPSTKTLMDGCGDIAPGSFLGRNFHFGIREHGMAAILNGIAAHGGFRPFGATFFVFVDYCRPSVRLSALMGLPVVYVFTHDSIYVGEDGPTHQPVEHLASLRIIPNMTVIRPADATETAAAWVAALKNRKGPTALLLTRQNLPTIDRTAYPPANMVEKGAYVLHKSKAEPKILLLASGSEVSLALDAAKQLDKEGTPAWVVSMPSWELFEKQSTQYKESVLPSSCKARLAIEAGVSYGWQRYTGEQGRILGIDHFGESGPYKPLGEKLGFSVANVLALAKEVLGK